MECSKRRNNFISQSCFKMCFSSHRSTVNRFSLIKPYLFVNFTASNWNKSGRSLIIGSVSVPLPSAVDRCSLISLLDRLGPPMSAKTDLTLLYFYCETTFVLLLLHYKLPRKSMVNGKQICNDDQM